MSSQGYDPTPRQTSAAAEWSRRKVVAWVVVILVLVAGLIALYEARRECLEDYRNEFFLWPPGGCERVLE